MRRAAVAASFLGAKEPLENLAALLNNALERRRRDFLALRESLRGENERRALGVNLGR